MNDLSKEFRSIIEKEKKAIGSLKYNDQLKKMILILTETKGEVLTTGIGKSGYISRLVASMFATYGIKASYLDPVQALHGEQGRVHIDDTIFLISNSGETEELIELLKSIRSQKKITVCSILSSRETTLGKFSEVIYETGTIKESCYFGVFPTTSITVVTVLSHAIAHLLVAKKGHGLHKVMKNHPNGRIGEIQ